MDIPIIKLEGASESVCAAFPISTHLCDPRNYKMEVLRILEYKAFQQSIPDIGFDKITPNAVTFLKRMSATYNLTIYYSCSKKKTTAQTAKQTQMPSLTQEELNTVVGEDVENARSVNIDGPPTN